MLTYVLLWTVNPIKKKKYKIMHKHQDNDKVINVWNLLNTSKWQQKVVKMTNCLLICLPVSGPPCEVVEVKPTPLTNPASQPVSIHHNIQNLVLYLTKSQRLLTQLADTTITYNHERRLYDCSLGTVRFSTNNICFTP